MFVKGVANPARTSGCFLGELHSHLSSSLELCGLVQGQKRHHAGKQPCEGSRSRVSPGLSAVGFSQGFNPFPCARAPWPLHQHTVGSRSPHAISRPSDPNCPLLTAKGCPAALRLGPSSTQAWLMALPEPSTDWDPGDHPSPPTGYPPAPWLSALQRVGFFRVRMTTNISRHPLLQTCL